MSQIKELSLDKEKDIVINIKTFYGTNGAIICKIMNNKGDTIKELFELNLANVNKNQKIIISKDWIRDDLFIIFNIKILPMLGKSKKECHIVINQDKEKIHKYKGTTTIDTFIIRNK